MEIKSGERGEAIGWSTRRFLPPATGRAARKFQIFLARSKSLQ
jgi:hypothetical protein